MEHEQIAGLTAELITQLQTNLHLALQLQPLIWQDVQNFLEQIPAGEI